MAKKGRRGWFFKSRSSSSPKNKFPVEFVVIPHEEETLDYIEQDLISLGRSTINSSSPVSRASSGEINPVAVSNLAALCDSDNEDDEEEDTDNDNDGAASHNAHYGREEDQVRRSAGITISQEESYASPFRNLMLIGVLFVLFVSLELRKPHGRLDLFVFFSIKVFGAFLLGCIMIVPDQDLQLTRKSQGLLARRLKLLVVYVLAFFYVIDLGYEAVARIRLLPDRTAVITNNTAAFDLVPLSDDQTSSILVENLAPSTQTMPQQQATAEEASSTAAEEARSILMESDSAPDQRDSLLPSEKLTAPAPSTRSNETVISASSSWMADGLDKLIGKKSGIQDAEHKSLSILSTMDDFWHRFKLSFSAETETASEKVQDRSLQLEIKHEQPSAALTNNNDDSIASDDSNYLPSSLTIWFQETWDYVLDFAPALIQQADSHKETSMDEDQCIFYYCIPPFVIGA